MEIFNEIWVWIGTALGGVSLASIISAIIYGCLKGAFNKTISKINVEKISQAATEKGVERVKKISFVQSIQPLVDSELKKITEQANTYIKTELENVEKKYDKLVNVLEKLSAYFDNSIGVSEEKKVELKQAILEAKNEPLTAQSVVVEEIPTKVSIVAPSTEETPKKPTKVER